jgi:hypothetical protein
MEFNELEKSKILIPDLWDNLNQPSDKQLKIHYKSFPNMEQARLYITQMSNDNESGRGHLKLHVDKIENLTVNGKKISSVDDLFECEHMRVRLSILASRMWNYMVTDGADIEPGESEASE